MQQTLQYVSPMNSTKRIIEFSNVNIASKTEENTPLNARRKLNVNKTFRRRPTFSKCLNVQFTSCNQGDAMFAWFVAIL